MDDLLISRLLIGGGSGHSRTLTEVEINGIAWAGVVDFDQINLGLSVVPVVSWRLPAPSRDERQLSLRWPLVRMHLDEARRTENNDYNR